MCNFYYSTLKFEIKDNFFLIIQREGHGCGPLVCGLLIGLVVVVDTPDDSEHLRTGDVVSGLGGLGALSENLGCNSAAAVRIEGNSVTGSGTGIFGTANGADTGVYTINTVAVFAREGRGGLNPFTPPILAGFQGYAATIVADTILVFSGICVLTDGILAAVVTKVVRVLIFQRENLRKNNFQKEKKNPVTIAVTGFSYGGDTRI